MTVKITAPEYAQLLKMQKEAYDEYYAARNKLAALDYAIRQAQLVCAGLDDLDDDQFEEAAHD